MNKERRKKIEQIQDKLMELQADLQWIREEEEEAFDNLPEQFQDGERGESMQEAMQAMEDADGAIQEAIDYLSDWI